MHQMTVNQNVIIFQITWRLVREHVGWWDPAHIAIGIWSIRGWRRSIVIAGWCSVCRREVLGSIVAGS